MKESISNTGAYRHTEAYKRSQLARLHGLPSDHHLIRPNDPSYLPKINAAIVALGAAASSDAIAATAQAVRNAPDDATPAAPAPRSCNTGDTSEFRVTRSILEQGRVKPTSPRLPVARPSTRVAVEKHSFIKIDWVSATWPNVTDDENQRILLAGLTELLEYSDVGIHPRSKGLHGYEFSANLNIFSEGGGDYIAVGMMAWSARQGVMLQISGKGCDYVQQAFDVLYDLAADFDGRLTRLDLALDLPSDYCLDRNITVPRLGVSAHTGHFANKYAPQHVKQSLSYAGDWSPILFGGVTPEKYDPTEHSPKGLTLYIGGAGADNQIVCYEKGKQLLGNVPDDAVESFHKLLQGAKTPAARQLLQKQMSDYGYDPAYESKKGWVRVERRLKRGSGKKDIPLDMLLRPDDAFMTGYPALETMLLAYQQYCQVEQIEPSEIKFARQADVESLILTRKLYWAKIAYGRLMRTLADHGLAPDKVLALITRDAGLKDYIFDLYDER